METLYPTSHYVRSNWLRQESKRTKWTQEENKWFESALAIFDKETPDRWTNVAAFIPGKSVYDVKRQYEELEADISSIEAGLVPSPVYMTSSFTLELVDDRSSSFSSFRKRPSMGRSCDHERKKGVPWTEDEHRRFLMGLERHGKGDWRNISRNYVITKTPTQVASHAQKYYARQLSEGKEKRRPSIHDITMVHLPDTTTPSDNQSSPLFEKCSTFSQPHKATSTPKILLDWNNSNDGGVMVLTRLIVTRSWHIRLKLLLTVLNCTSTVIMDLTVQDFRFSPLDIRFLDETAKLAAIGGLKGCTLNSDVSAIM